MQFHFRGVQHALSALSQFATGFQALRKATGRKWMIHVPGIAFHSYQKWVGIRYCAVDYEQTEDSGGVKKTLHDPGEEKTSMTLPLQGHALWNWLRPIIPE